MTRVKLPEDMESRMISCPKCGHIQEDRADCLKCGIIFAKFYALHTGEQNPGSETVDLHESAPAIHEEIPPAEMALMRQTVRDLGRRFSELEFERVERGRLRSDLRDLDRKLQAKLDEIFAALAAQDSKIGLLNERPQGPSAQDFASLSRELHEADLQGMQARQAQLESHITKIESQGILALDGSRLMDLLGDYAEQLRSLDDGFRAHLAATEGSSSEPMSSQTSEELEKLRASLQAVSLRYSEIGELKKNYLVLENKLETLNEAFDACRTENQQVSKARIEDLGKEVSTLRAEVRHAIERLSSAETHAAQSLPDVHPLKSDFDSLSRLRAEDAERFQRELAALAQQFDDVSRTQAGLQARLESLGGMLGSFDGQAASVERRIEQLTDRADALPDMFVEVNRQNSELRDELQKSLARIEWIESKLSELASPAPPAPETPATLPQNDMVLIRQNLDEIRRFMEGLSRKS